MKFWKKKIQIICKEKINIITVEESILVLNDKIFFVESLQKTKTKPANSSPYFNIYKKYSFVFLVIIPKKGRQSTRQQTCGIKCNNHAYNLTHCFCSRQNAQVCRHSGTLLQKVCRNPTVPVNVFNMSFSESQSTEKDDKCTNQFYQQQEFYKLGRLKRQTEILERSKTNSPF